MHEAFRRAGVRQCVFAGDIWNIPDNALHFGDDNPSRRTLHDTRYVLVMQGDDEGDNAACPTVLVVPLSSKGDAKAAWEDWLEPSETDLHRPSVVKLHLIQPVPRRLLLERAVYIGRIPDDTLARLQRHLLENLGIR